MSVMIVCLRYHAKLIVSKQNQTAKFEKKIQGLKLSEYHHGTMG